MLVVAAPGMKAKDFAWALESLKTGLSVRREGKLWRLFLDLERPALTCHPTLGGCFTWSPGVEDLLAQDWELAT
jgi:hypothetical protein